MKRRQKYDWVKLIGEWEKSGLSQAEFCRQNTLDQHLFSKQKIKHGKESESGFIEIKFKNTDIDSGIEVIAGRFAIKIKPDFDKILLKQVLEVIGEIR
jgi:hypothetical protein